MSDGLKAAYCHLHGKRTAVFKVMSLPQLLQATEIGIVINQCGRTTSANLGGGSFLSKAVNLDSACVAIELHIALCLAAHAECPGRDKGSIIFCFAIQNCS